MHDVRPDSITHLLQRCLVGFYAYKQRNEAQIRAVVAHLVLLAIDSTIVKLEDKADCQELHDVLLSFIEMQKVLKGFNMVDPRMGIAQRLLLNIYKKQFFNQVTTILMNMLNRLKDPSYLVLAGKPYYVVFIDFFRELRSFFNEVLTLQAIPNFSEITLDFRRKLFYVFFNNLRQIIAQDAV